MQFPKKLQKMIKIMKFVEIHEPNLDTLKKSKKSKKCTHECIRMQKTLIFAKLLSFAIRIHS